MKAASNRGFLLSEMRLLLLIPFLADPTWTRRQATPQATAGFTCGMGIILVGIPELWLKCHSWLSAIPSPCTQPQPCTVYHFKYIVRIMREPSALSLETDRMRALSVRRRPLFVGLATAAGLTVSMILLISGSVALAAAKLTFTGLQPSPVEVYRGESRQLEYEFVNTSARDLKIESVFPRKGKGAGKATPSSLAPGAKGRISLNFTFPEAIGRGQVNFLVKTDSPDLRTQVIELKYFVQSALEPELAVFDFGEMHSGQRLRSNLTVSSRLVTDLKLTRVISKPEWLEVAFLKPAKKPQSVEIVATTTGAPSFGLTTGDIVVATNLAEAPQLRIPVVVRSFNKYSVTPFPVTFGAVNEGLDERAKLRIKRWGPGDVHIKEIETGSPALSTEAAPCGEGCVELTVTFDSMRARGGLRTLLTVHFTDDPVPLGIPMDALVVPIGVTRKDLGDLNAVTVKSTTTTLEPSP